MLKEPYTLSKEPCIVPKEPYILQYFITALYHEKQALFGIKMIVAKRMEAKQNAQVELIIGNSANNDSSHVIQGIYEFT